MERDDSNESLTKGEFRTFEKRMFKTETKIDSFEGKVDSLEGKVDSLEGKVDRLEGKFDSLEGKFNTLEGRLDSAMITINARFDRIESQMVTKDEVITKDDWSKHMTMMDAMMTEIEASREERIFFEQQRLRTDDAIHDHERRIGVLEKSSR